MGLPVVAISSKRFIKLVVRLSTGMVFIYSNYELSITNIPQTLTRGNQVIGHEYFPLSLPNKDRIENQSVIIRLTFVGFGFVLSNYFSWHTPFDKFKRIVN
jgi:hypothetical protein